MLWGTLVGGGPFVLWVVVTRWLHVPFVPLFVLPPLVLFPLAIAYTLLHGRTLDIDWIVRRVVTYILLTVLAVGFYLLLFMAVGYLLRPAVSPSHPVLLILFALLVALGAQPARVAIQRVVDRVVLGRRITPERALRDFSQVATTSRTEEEVVEALARVLERALAPRYALFYSLDERTGQYVPRVLSGVEPHLVRFRSDGPLASRMAAESQPLYLSAGELEPELEAEQPRLASLGPALFVPLPGQGWLALGPTHARRFRAADMRLVEVIVPQAAAALERVRLISDLERRVTELETLRRIAQAASFSVELDDLLELIYAQTSRVLDTTNFYIALHDPEKHTLSFAFYVEDGERRYPDDVWADSEGLTSTILRTGQTITADDYLAECQRRGIQPAGKPGRAWMGVPLISRDRVLGVMNVSSFTPDAVYTEDQAQVFRAIADQAAAILDKARLYHRMEERARELEALNEVGSAVTSTLDLDAVLDLIVQKAMDLVNAEAGSLFLVDEETGDMIFYVASTPELIGVRLPRGTGIVGQAAEQAKPITVDNARQDERWFKGVDEQLGFGTQTVIAVPMISRDKVIGVIEFMNRRDGRPFDADDRRLLMAFASDAAIAIENARLFTMTDRALAERVEELSIMQRIDRELNTTLDYQRVMDITLEWALKVTGADIGLLAVVVEMEDGGQGLRFLANRGYPEELISVHSEEPWSLGQGLIGRVVRTGEPELVADVGSDPDYVPVVPGMVAQVTVPIRREEEIVGLIALESGREDTLDDEAMAFVVRLADHAAIALENARLFEAVQAANNAKTEFVSFVSHELKQPMTSIKGYSDLLTKGTAGELTEMQRSFMEVIRSNVGRMDRLVQDLLDVSRIEAGRLKLEIGSVSMEEVVQDALRGVRQQMEEKEQTLDVQLHTPLPRVAADHSRLVQVLVNLLSNAYKYTPEGGTIRVVAEPVDGRFVQCSVTDTGIGMTEEEQERLFTKYFRSDDPAVRSVPGTGLGLVITKSLVELQGGEIWVESELGKGSTFAFTVPVLSEAE